MRYAAPAAASYLQCKSQHTRKGLLLKPPNRLGGLCRTATRSGHALPRTRPLCCKYTGYKTLHFDIVYANARVCAISRQVRHPLTPSPPNPQQPSLLLPPPLTTLPHCQVGLRTHKRTQASKHREMRVGTGLFWYAHGESVGIHRVGFVGRACCGKPHRVVRVAVLSNCGCWQTSMQGTYTARGAAHALQEHIPMR